MAEGVLDIYHWLMGGPTGVGAPVDPYIPLAYPLEIPTAGGIRSITWLYEKVRGVSESPFTLHRKVQRRQGERLKAVVTLPTMPRNLATEWESFLLALDGGYGSFLFGDYLNPNPRGKANGAPAVNGANQIGNILVTSGWDKNISGLLKPGDTIQIGSTLHINLRNVNSDSSGIATLDIFPRVRTAHANGTPIITQGARGTFALDGASAAFSSRDIDGFHTIPAFQVVEVF